MRILYLTHYFYPEFGAAAARAYGMTRWLVRFGHDVTVLAPFPNYLIDQTPAIYRGQRLVEEMVDGVRVMRVWLYASSKRGTMWRMVNYLSAAASIWWFGRRLRGTFDVVVASSPPLFLGPVGVKLAQYYSTPFVFDVRDMWPEIGIKLEAFREGSLVEKIWRAMADYTYSRASAILPVTKGMMADMIDLGLPTERLYLIRNGVDIEEIRMDVPDLRRELSLEDKFVVLFAGLIGVMQGVDVVIEAANLLRTHKDICFLIVGDGVCRAEIEARVAELKLDTVRLFPKQSPERLSRFLNTADVCLAPLANQRVDGVVPYKMLEAWAYRRPVIITDAGGEGGSLAISCRAGLATPAGDAKALAEAILTLKEDRILARQMGMHGWRCIQKGLTREALARRFEKVLLHITR